MEQLINTIKIPPIDGFELRCEIFEWEGISTSPWNSIYEDMLITAPIQRRAQIVASKYELDLGTVSTPYYDSDSGHKFTDEFLFNLKRQALMMAKEKLNFIVGEEINE